MTTIAKKLHHLTYEERIHLYDAMKYNTHSITELSEELGRSRQSLYRELGRNNVSPPKIKNPARRNKYDYERARRDAERRWNVSHTRSRIPDDTLKNEIVYFLNKGYSPKQIAGTLAIQYERPRICHETIYQWIYHDRQDLSHTLLSHRKKRRPKKRNRTSITRIPNRTPLTLRSDCENMNEFGHWEVDLVGSSSSATVLVLN